MKILLLGILMAVLLICPSTGQTAAYSWERLEGSNILLDMNSIRSFPWGNDEIIQVTARYALPDGTIRQETIMIKKALHLYHISLIEYYDDKEKLTNRLIGNFKNPTLWDPMNEKMERILNKIL